MVRRAAKFRFYLIHHQCYGAWSGRQVARSDAVGQLAALRTLNLSNCSLLQSLPAEIGQLAALRTLDLSHCRALQSLPAEVVKLTKMHFFTKKCLKISSSNTGIDPSTFW